MPAGTQSFVLNMRDMDVARNRTTDDQAHWVVWNIPATATGLPEGVPKGAQLAGRQLSDQRHRPMYRGPARRRTVRCITTCSSSTRSTPSSTSQPAADAFETRANVMKAMQGHILGKAVYGGLFKRPAG